MWRGKHLRKPAPSTLCCPFHCGVDLPWEADDGEAAWERGRLPLQLLKITRILSWRRLNQKTWGTRAQGFSFCNEFFWSSPCKGDSCPSSTYKTNYPSPLRQTSVAKLMRTFVRFALHHDYFTLMALYIQIGQIWGSGASFLPFLEFLGIIIYYYIRLVISTFQ